MVYTTYLEPSLDDTPSVGASLLPSGNSVAIFASPSTSSKAASTTQQDGQNIYFAAFDGIGGMHSAG